MERLQLRRLLLLACGWVCVGLGFVGLFLPVLPTTPFLLLAAAAFSRSSQTLANWLYQHQRLGPALSAWEEYRVIPLRGKILATVMMMASVAYLWLLAPLGNIVRVIVSLIVASTLIYIWSKPHRRPGE